MKYFIYLSIIFILGACAVQGYIPGGPEDIISPKLDIVFPENRSIIKDDQRIIIKFDKALEPNSVQKSIKIDNNDYKIMTRKNKIIIQPSTKWNKNQILNIYVSRDLMDYRNNNINGPLEFSFSFGQKIPTNTIRGDVIDIDNIINSYIDNKVETAFEVGLYNLSKDEKKIIKKVETNELLEFSFSAIENGIYSIIAIEDKIIDLNQDIRNRKYSILSDSLFITDETDDYLVTLNIGNPVSKEEISSINFINQYYVDYILTNGEYKSGVLDSIYNNFGKEDFSNKELSISIAIENEFEEYNTSPFIFSVPEIIDSISPGIQECSIVDSVLNIKFSEPTASFDAENLFYYTDIDSNKVFFDILNFDPKYATIAISLNQKEVDSLVIEIKENTIRDLSNNFMDESTLSISNCDKVVMEVTNYGFGAISGKVETNNLNELVVIAYNVTTRESKMTLVNNNKFNLKMLEPGEYFLQAYENYDVKDSTVFPFYSGSWEPFIPSVEFSKISGPIEVRSNWDIEDLIINF